MRAQPCAPVSWSSSTGRQRHFWTAAGQESPSPGHRSRSTGKARNASQRNGSGSGTAANRRPRSGSAGRTAGSRNGTARKNTTNRKQGGGRRSRTPRTNYAVLGLLLAMLVLGLLFRWMGMGK